MEKFSALGSEKKMIDKLFKIIYRFKSPKSGSLNLCVIFYSTYNINNGINAGTLPHLPGIFIGWIIKPNFRLLLKSAKKSTN